MEEQENGALLWSVLQLRSECRFCSPPVFHHCRWFLALIALADICCFCELKIRCRILASGCIYRRLTKDRERERDASHHKSVWTAEEDCGSLVKNGRRGVNIQSYVHHTLLNFHITSAAMWSSRSRDRRPGSRFAGSAVRASAVVIRSGWSIKKRDVDSSSGRVKRGRGAAKFVRVTSWKRRCSKLLHSCCSWSANC